MTDHSKPSSYLSSPTEASRRRFIQRSSLILAGGAIGSNLDAARGSRPSGSDTIRIGLVGCGNRGTAAAIEMLHTDGGGTELVALGDVFEHQLQRSYRSIKGRHSKKVSTELVRSVGLDSYKQVFASDADVVILATPPVFRPQHFAAAVAAGKHVFMEAPIAIDAPGIRHVLASGRAAQDARLAVRVGFQRRFETRYQETIAKLREGLIGELLYGRVYCNAGRRRLESRREEMSESEYQLRNWRDFAGLSGDQIVEQHVQHLDVIQWLLRSEPLHANGMGSQTRDFGPGSRQSGSHDAVEFSYPGGFRLISQCRQQADCWNKTGEFVHGSEGWCDLSEALVRDQSGRKIWQSEAREIKGKGWQQEQNDLLAALRLGTVPNDVEDAAASTMTAILGRMAVQSGQLVMMKDALNDLTSLAHLELDFSKDRC